MSFKTLRNLKREADVDDEDVEGISIPHLLSDTVIDVFKLCLVYSFAMLIFHEIRSQLL